MSNTDNRHANTAGKPYVDRYVVVDDTSWRSRHGHSYTMRCWRRQGCSSIVVATPDGHGSPPPDLYSAALANLAMRRLHGWQLGFAYYEASRFGADERLFMVTWQVIGKHGLRPILARPAYLPADPRALAATLGESSLC